MSLSRSTIDNFFTPNFSKNSATATFVRDRKLSVYYKKTKWPYLSPRVSNLKNKTTLFPSTFKTEGNKVVLFFDKRLRSLDMVTLSFTSFLTEKR